MTKRLCLFCDRKAGSAEHMFPDWLNKIFPVEPSDPTPEWSQYTADDGAMGSNTFGAAQIAGVKTKLVCHDCNTGWMSRLEERAEQILTPMIKGNHCRLNNDEQFIVATWATKTAMVIEPTLTKLNRFTREQCSIVRMQDHPPGSVVGVASAVEGSIAPMGYWCAKMHVILGTTAFRDFHFHTVQLGCLVLQILRMDPPPADYGTLEPLAVPTEIELPYDIALNIFPPRGDVTWPPQRVLNGAGLVDLTHRGLEMPPDWDPPGAHLPE